MAKILVIDDDQAILRLVENTLRTEHTVETATEMTKTQGMYLDRYDLIILDVMMPGKDGFSICSEIRSLVDCPILFLTAKTMEDDVTYGFSVGADDYIRKPFSVAELRARVNAHLRRENRERVQVFEQSGVRFYLQKGQACVGEVVLPFTRSEYDIALFLAHNHGQTFSKEQIYEKIYGFEKDGNDSAITEHIKNIRKKFREMPEWTEKGTEPIETVWGIGYWYDTDAVGLCDL